jgi:hypothetical protein
MKHLFLFICITLTVPASAQLSSRSFVPFSIPAASGSSRAPAYAPGNGAFDATQLPTFGLYGIGNTNTETFSNINSSGKLSGYIRPFKGTIKGIPTFIDVNFGFDANASNTDSLLASTVLFPDVGKNSFSGSIVLNFALGKEPNFYLISPFLEFAQKTISGTKADSTKSFYTINSTYGINFQFLYVDAVSGDKVSFTLSPYLASVNIPDPGTGDYKYLFTGSEVSPLETTINSWGIKATFQYNYFQIFSDFRTVKGDATQLPVPGLRGFHPNIGIIFNAEIFEK